MTPAAKPWAADDSVGRGVASPAVGCRQISVEGALDLRRTLRPLGLTWAARDDDGWWKAMRTPEGPATLCIRRRGPTVLATGWGPGADWAIHAAERMIGCQDPGHEWRSDHPTVAALQRRYPGVRFGSTGLVFEAAVHAVVTQKVTGREAASGLRGITRRFSDPAPGPLPHLRLPPDPERMAGSAYHDYHDLGIERRRADTLLRLAADAPRIERLASVDVATATRYLARVRGVGEWTVNETLAVSHGHPDAVSVGDYHVKNIVAWQLSGEEKGSDERMLELLEPFRPHRGRVVRLLEYAGGAQRKGPRLPVRGFEHM